MTKKFGEIIYIYTYKYTHTCIYGEREIFCRTKVKVTLVTLEMKVGKITQSI